MKRQIRFDIARPMILSYALTAILLLNRYHDVRPGRRGEVCFVGGQALSQQFTTWVPWVRHVNGKIRHAMDSLHQAKQRDTFDDDGAA